MSVLALIVMLVSNFIVTLGGYLKTRSLMKKEVYTSDGSKKFLLFMILFAIIVFIISAICYIVLVELKIKKLGNVDLSNQKERLDETNETVTEMHSLEEKAKLNKISEFIQNVKETVDVITFS